MMKKTLITCCMAATMLHSFAITDYQQKADSLIALMTLDEKIGQLNQYSGDALATGPVVNDTSKLSQVKAGMLGSMLNVIGAEQTRSYQEAAIQSRLRIPLLFGQDVIHGFRTIFPLPLAEAASFDLQAIEESARWAAIEASASGIHWTFAPMVDISWDARWGRVMEGAGEDPYYVSAVAKARIKGFQGENLADTTTILACAKHFAAYGAPVAGKDYNSVDMSIGHFYNYYLPPYKAAKEAGVATFMNAFNDFNNIPCSANEFLLKNILRNDWDFEGFVVSDWGSIGEMVDHRYAQDKADAAQKAIKAGTDMDMESRSYIRNLANLVNAGKVSEEEINKAVKRILIKKFQLGLFDDPFRYSNKDRETRVTLNPRIKDAARNMAKRSIVLLKNDNHTLPLSNKIHKIALIGSLGDSKEDMSGFWANERIVSEMVTVKEGLINKGYQVDYIPAYNIATYEIDNIKKIIRQAQKSDAIIICVGERWNESGEAKSRGNIEINHTHQSLVCELAKIGKPNITLIMGGRPLIFNHIKESSDAILFTWWLGTQAGNAIADVICGDYNPSAKLPMTFPLHIAQIPIHYNYKSTGRPENPGKGYTTSYMDIDYLPAYPFGFGLSYSNFDISSPKYDKQILTKGSKVNIQVEVTNKSEYDGEEVVQLYIQDKVASITRPIKELKGFKKVFIKANESSFIEFEITEKELGFYDNNGKFVIEPGEFIIMTGGDSQNLKFTTIKYQ